jgi:hypothetical protein
MLVFREFCSIATGYARCKATVSAVNMAALTPLGRITTHVRISIRLLLLLLTLALSLFGCTAPQRGEEEKEAVVSESALGQAADSTLEQDDKTAYRVELSAMTDEELREAFAADPKYADRASDVDSATLSVDEAHRSVTIEMEVSVAEISEATAIAEAYAQCLSDRSKVIDTDGVEVLNKEPCGALYEVYSLSIRCIARSDWETLLIDGWLPAGASEMTWQ